MFCVKVTTWYVDLQCFEIVRKHDVRYEFIFVKLLIDLFIMKLFQLK